MKTIQANFNEGLREGWTMFWAPFAYVIRKVASVFRSR